MRPLLLIMALAFFTGCRSNAPVAGGLPRAITPSPAADPYLGQPLPRASATAEAEGRRWRVIERDGVPLAATRDYWPERLNFAVRDGVVIRVTKG